ncbi:histone H1B, sperm-like [Lineus longissimus]|uniref:histone H1B, sperm-like n=1 Tax=Lineus longissimus TaxID=88925 RepID=UPI002B4E066F
MSESAPAAKKATKPRKQKVAATHPKTSDMVAAAIRSLKERKGSSLAAIKKYIHANYKVDAVKINPFIRRYLKKAVEDKVLVQTKGSYKLSEAAKKDKPKKKPVKTKKPVTPKKVKKPKSPKKPKAKKATKAKTPKKAKAAKPKKVKSPKKPKAAKPKKAKPAKKPAKTKAKKAASKKK